MLIVDGLSKSTIPSDDKATSYVYNGVKALFVNTFLSLLSSCSLAISDSLLFVIT